MSRRLALCAALAILLTSGAAAAVRPGSAHLVDVRRVLAFGSAQAMPFDLLDLSPDGSLIAYRTARGRLAILDLADNRATVLPARLLPEASAAFSPAGDRLVYRDGTEVKTIDLRRRTIDTVGWSPSGPLYWLRDGRIAFAGSRHRLTFVSTGGVRTETGTKLSPSWALSPDGRSALVRTRCTTRLIARGRAKILARGLEVPERAWSPDGAYLVLERPQSASCGNSGRVEDFLFDRHGNRIGGDITGQTLSHGHDVSWSADGRWLFVAVQPTGTEVTGYQLVEALSLRTLRVSTIIRDGNVGRPLMGPGNWLVFGRYGHPRLAARGRSGSAIFVGRLVG